MEKLQEMKERIKALEEQMKAQQEQVKAQQELLDILAPYVMESRRKLDQVRDSGMYNFKTFKQNRISKAQEMNKTGALSEPIEIMD